MPTVALHSHYWQFHTPPPEVGPGASGGGGYVPWQIVIPTLVFWLIG